MSDTAILRIVRVKPQRSKRLRKKELPMALKELFEILEICSETAYMIKNMWLRSLNSRLGPCVDLTLVCSRHHFTNIMVDQMGSRKLAQASGLYDYQEKSSGDFQRQSGLITVKEDISAGACEQKHIDDSDLSMVGTSLTDIYLIKHVAVCGDVEDEFGSRSTVVSVRRLLLTRPGDEFDEADFNVANKEHPDEVSLETIALSENNHSASGIQMTAVRNAQKLRAPPPRIPPPPSGPTLRPQTLAKPRVPGETRSNESGGPSCVTNEGYNHLGPFGHQQGRPNADALPAPLPVGSHEVSLALTVPPGFSTGSPHVRGDQESSKSPKKKPLSFETPAAPDYGAPVGFFTARAAETVQNTSGLPLKAPAFNPHLESPSIRKTAGWTIPRQNPLGGT